MLRSVITVLLTMLIVAMLMYVIATKPIPVHWEGYDEPITIKD